MSILHRMAAIIVAILAAGTAGAGEPPEFLVSYWGGPPAAETTVERYREIADCGFNVAMPPGDRTDLKTNLKILDACRAVGIKAIVADDRLFDEKGALAARKPAELEKALDAVVGDYSSHPALAGYFIKDEPHASLFPLLGTINQYLLKKDPKHLSYVNLFPNYATAAQLGNARYEEHVSQFITTVKPALVSWDHYRQMAGDEKLYFTNLEIVRDLCLKQDLPFVQIVLSMPHWGYRNPSEADLRWQVYTSLAYGVKGVAYFTYWTWTEQGLGKGPAIINAEGKRDAKYEIVRRINARLRALGPLLMRLRSTGVYHTAPLPPGTQALAAGAPVHEASGGPMVIGCFQDAAGSQYVLVVNRSFKDALLARLTMDERTTSVSEVSQETGSPSNPPPRRTGFLKSGWQPAKGGFSCSAQEAPDFPVAIHRAKVGGDAETCSCPIVGMTMPRLRTRTRRLPPRDTIWLVLVDYQRLPPGIPGDQLKLGIRQPGMLRQPRDQPECSRRRNSCHILGGD